MRGRIFILVLAFLALAACPLSAQGRPSYKIKPTGSFTMSAGAFPGAEGNYTQGMRVNDLRLGLRADLDSGWESELILGFTRGKVSFKEIFLRYAFPDRRSAFQFGHFAEPFGLEYIESPPFNRFASGASPSQAFAAKRKVGLQYMRWNDCLWGAAGVFADGNLMTGVTAGPQGYAFTARAVLNPRRGQGKILHAGAAATWRRADGNGDADRSVAFASNAEVPFDATNVATVTVDAARAQAKVAFEGILSFDRFCLMGEGYLTRVSREYDLAPYRAGGCYAQAGILLCGDRHYKYDATKARLSMCSSGTWELMLRGSLLDLNDNISKLYGGRMFGLSLNANWYATPFIRIRLSAGRTATDVHCQCGEREIYSISAQLMIMLN